MRMLDKWNPEFDDDESLDVFFAGLGIGDFWIGGRIGAYGIDCGHITNRTLSEIAWEDCTKFRDDRRHWLEHTTESPTTHGGPMGNGVSVELTSFGEVVTPQYMDVECVEYTFEYVEWQDEQFLLGVNVRGPTAEHGMKGHYRLSDLRRMIGWVPEPTVESSGLLARLWAVIARVQKRPCGPG